MRSKVMLMLMTLFFVLLKIISYILYNVHVHRCVRFLIITNFDIYNKCVCFRYTFIATVLITLIKLG